MTKLLRTPLGMHDGLAVAMGRKEEALKAMTGASLSVAGVALPLTEKTLQSPGINSPLRDIEMGGFR